jgi:hypothetical protein
MKKSNTEINSVMKKYINLDNYIKREKLKVHYPVIFKSEDADYKCYEIKIKINLDSFKDYELNLFDTTRDYFTHSNLSKEVGLTKGNFYAILSKGVINKEYKLLFFDHDIEKFKIKVYNYINNYLYFETDNMFDYLKKFVS